MTNLHASKQKKELKSSTNEPQFEVIMSSKSYCNSICSAIDTVHNWREFFESWERTRIELAQSLNSSMTMITINNKVENIVFIKRPRSGEIP